MRCYSEFTIDEAQSLWVEITSKIEAESNDIMLLTYIKHHWSFKHGYVREIKNYILK